ncbi:Flagellar basal body-associated protein FliL [Desulfatibacillum alkenivorans DSM 16219]|jgi:flagellar basal body-associated protein FliL|uniref:Flagellar basal body-associated protein FliL n=1 Tax=Desulfatibacillum alkenivorans DSM 16219 TaxID=1121393 RepID=A0A1M6HJU8_9BACT|nr:hypothetical protein [Desulfatibacillum alkenivorans]SHJ22454.1 Flagellar basal body-associated protein FliL [Desulfatibacillum alkenivorans DSM 16219]
MDDQDDATMPDTVILGGSAKSKKPAEEPWGGSGDDAPGDAWGGGNELDSGAGTEWGGGTGVEPDLDNSWGHEDETDQAFVPDPAMFEGMGDEEEAPEKSRFSFKRKWIMIPAAAVIVLAVGVVSFFMISGALDSTDDKAQATEEKAPQAAPAQAPAQAPVEAPIASGPTVDRYGGVRNVRLELEPFVIPYEDASKKTYLFLRVALEIDEKETYALLEANRPLLRGVIYDTVLEEMDRVGDKEAFSGSLQNLLAAKLKSVFSTMGIQKVIFSNQYSV